MTLPPGQHAVDGFPRFGTHLHHPPPAVPQAPAIEIVDGETNTRVPLTDLAALERRELTADFHCVAGWSARGLRWEGVAFADFHRAFIAPAPATHLVLVGLDGYAAGVRLEDVLADDVLLADRLDGRPLDGDHGAPVRLVTPRQYGYVNVKHLRRIELRTSEPRLERSFVDRLLAAHPRARVWEEERHRHVPGRALRLPYRMTIAPIRWLAARRS